MTPFYWLLVGVAVVAIGFAKLYLFRKWTASQNRKVAE